MGNFFNYEVLGKINYLLLSGLVKILEFFEELETDEGFSSMAPCVACFLVLVRWTLFPLNQNIGNCLFVLVSKPFLTLLNMSPD